VNTIEEIRELLGDSATIRFLAVFGGTSVTFCKRPEGQQYERMSRVVGEEAAEKLRHRFAGESFYIPKNDADARRVRDEEWAARIASGDSFDQVAVSTRVVRSYSGRHVRRRVEKLLRDEFDGRQLSLLQTA
jgi:Mor family transcriptional regulator